jgi:hypothetical protein
VVGFTTGSRGDVPGKICQKRRRNNNNNDKPYEKIYMDILKFQLTSYILVLIADYSFKAQLLLLCTTCFNSILFPQRGYMGFL